MTIVTMPAESKMVTLLAPACFSAPLAPPSPDQSISSEFEDSESASQNDTPQNSTCVVESVTQTFEQALMAAIGLPMPSIGNVPSAFCRYQLETAPVGNPQSKTRQIPEHIVCADPVHLLADKDNARLLPSAALDLRDTEADSLIASLNDLIGPDGLNVVKGQQGQWFLTGMDATALDSWPSHAVANGKIANFLPRLDAAGDWRRLMTEVQMLFHSHPVNEQRAARRALPVNGMWFWGGAKPPAVTPNSNVVVYADDSFSVGLAANYDTPRQAIANFDISTIAPDTTTVIVDGSIYTAWLAGDSDAVQQAKDKLVQHRVEPLQQAVSDGAIDEFVLDGCEGQAIQEVQPSRSRFSLLNWFKKRRGS